MITKSIQQKFVFYSTIFFVVISGLTVSSFWFSCKKAEKMRVKQSVENIAFSKRTSFSNSINKEIFLSSVLAESPLVKSYFLNPSDIIHEQQFLAEMKNYQQSFKDNIIFWVSDVDKNFFYNNEYSYTINPENIDDYWYKMTLYETEKYNLNINYNPDLDAINLWINTPVFLYDKALGMLGTGVNLSDFTNNFFKNLDQNTEMIFFNDKNEITGHKNGELVAQKENINIVYPWINSILKEGLSELSVLEDRKNFEFVDDGISYSAVLIPVPEIQWYILVYQPSTGLTFKDSISSNLIMILVLLFFVFVGMNLFIWLSILKPMIKIKSGLGLIAKGNLTGDFKTKRVDELGELCSSITKINTGITGMIRNVEGSISEVTGVGMVLQKNSSQTFKAIDDIVVLLDNMKKKINSQSQNESNITIDIDKMTENIDLLNNLITNQSQSIEESSSAIEEVIANLNSVVKMNNQAKEKVKKLEETSSIGRNNMKEVSQIVTDISVKSETLLEANKMIAGIAAQTNLLAMNAAIEAAHAGDSGKGFSVVSEQIRKLAEQSRMQSTEIKAYVQDIQNSILSVVSASERSVDSFEIINDEIIDVSNAFAKVKGAMDEQAVGGQRILVTLNEMKSITEQVEKGSEEMKVRNEEMSSQLKEFSTSTKTIEDSVLKVTDESHKIRNSITKITNLTDKNSVQITHITENISKFTLAKQNIG